MRCVAACLAVLVSGTISMPAHAVVTSFQGLGDLSGGDAYSWVDDVSADGSTIVGYSSSGSGFEAYRWTSLTGMVGLGDLPGGPVSSRASAVSADGSVIGGFSNFTSWSGTSGEAFRWTQAGGMAPLGYLPGGNAYSGVGDMSADGSVLVGGSDTPGMNMGYRWTNATGMVNVGDLPGSSTFSALHAVSPDGSIAVGWGTGTAGREAIRMTGSTIAAGDGLGDLPGGSFYSVGYDLSNDGSVVVGRSNSSSGPEAYRWTAGTGMVGLGDLPGGSFESHSMAVSADGSVIVGIGVTALGREAFIWNADSGMRNLRNVLVNDYGVNLTGWKLTHALGISDDGGTIIGGGINPSGKTEAWIAVIPEPPQTIYLNFDGNDGGGRADVMRAILRNRGRDDSWNPEATDVAADFGFSGDGRTTIGLATVVASRVADDFARFNVNIVRERPSSGDYMEVFIGGGHGDRGLAGTAQAVLVSGRWDIDSTNDNLNDSAIVFTDNMGQWLQDETMEFLVADGTRGTAYTADENLRWARTIIWLSNTTSHEIAHNLGLSHVVNNTNPRDLLMQNWTVSRRFAQNDAFQNNALALANGSGTQNSVGRLAHEVGLAYEDPNVTPQAPANAGSSLDILLDDVDMKDAVVVFTTEDGFDDSVDERVVTEVIELGPVSGDRNLSYFLGQSYFPLQVVLVGKSSVGGDFDLVFGSGFSDSSFAPFSSIEEISATLLANPNLSTLDDLAAGFNGWDLLNSAFVPGEMSGRVVPIPEPSTLILLTMGAVGLLAYGWRRRRVA